jgi:hypothetical protein
MTLRWQHLGWPVATRAAVRDLWLHRDMGVSTDSYGATVGSHDVVALRLTPETVLGVARATASPGSAKITRPRLAVIVAAARPAPDVGTYSLCGRRIAGRTVEAMGVVVLAAGVQ